MVKASIYLLATAFLLVFDILWLSLFMGRRFSPMIQKIQKSKMTMNYLYAAIAYTFMVLGLIFIVIPLIDYENKEKEKTGKKNEFLTCLKIGGIFGIVLYGVYDFTSAATFTNWSIPLAILDVLWGGFVYFISTYLAFLIL